MISQVMNLINTSLSACIGFFSRVFTAAQTIEVYLAFLFIFFSFKFILSPIFGFASFAPRIKSDMARDQKTKSKASGKKSK